MRARVLGVAIVLAVAAATGCGDDGGSDGDDSGSGGSDDSSAELQSYANAAAVAEALGCADSFAASEVPDFEPSPRSIGFCEGAGEPMIEVYDEAEMDQVRSAVRNVSCRLSDGDFTWVVGANWLVTPSGEPDQAVNEELATTLGGELLACD